MAGLLVPVVASSKLGTFGDLFEKSPGLSRRACVAPFSGACMAERGDHALDRASKHDFRGAAERPHPSQAERRHRRATGSFVAFWSCASGPHAHPLPLLAQWLDGFRDADSSA